MSGCRLFMIWVGCIMAGAVIGFLIGYALWQLGFELLGSATAMIGSVVGGALMFFGIFAWSERRQTARRNKR